MPKNHNSLSFSVKDQLAALVLRVTLRLSSFVSLDTARGLGRRLTRIVLASNTNMVRVTRRNIELAYSHLDPLQQQRLVEASIREQGALIAEMGHVWCRSPEYVMSRLRVVGQEHVDAALAKKRGVLVLAPHVGNWEVLPHHLVTQGSLFGLFEPPKLPAIGQVVLAGRQRPGGVYVPTSRKGLIQLIRHFKSGGLTGILPDQVPHDVSAGRNVPFMGVECFTATLSVNLLAKSGAQALFAGVFRVPGGWEVVYHKASEAVYSPDAETALAAMNSDIARLISGRDEQYQWSYRRFKRRPQSVGDHYQGLK